MTMERTDGQERGFWAVPEEAWPRHHLVDIDRGLQVLGQRGGP